MTLQLSRVKLYSNRTPANIMQPPSAQAARQSSMFVPGERAC